MGGGGARGSRVRDADGIEQCLSVREGTRVTWVSLTHTPVQ